MKTLTKFAISAICMAGLVACTASSEGIAAETAISEATPSKEIKPYATVKPGANVTLESVLPKTMTPGTYQTVKLRLFDQYSTGALSVRIEPSAGLSLFGGQSKKSFDMTAEGPHEWDVDVQAETDGVYFLNVFASANGQPRSFSVRVDVGVVTQKMFDDAMPADGELTDGGTIRALEATETIK